ncbi:vacuolar protein sorting-associated protein Vps17 [Hyaloscypha bicolor E]|uniref:Vacuolar protein sorting-associated protein 17 n=1 Tax=Hyaloscypha bicolor E TaxID=1095630 RepID=A0A2J6STM1_9HELO|nr:vacuolar protein sorting-associated protein Vps17 [Hyaloscypha bicolor E]PMD54109.1 vacuolar protein sorting-associated protein Vps17 [Hyaloscypha bicolor E]
MDYSASIQEDHPAGTSPWGSSPVASPQHPRTSSFGAPGDVPPSPTPYLSNQSSTGFSQDDTLGGGSYQGAESSVGEGSVTESDGHRPNTADSIRSQPEQQQTYPGQQQQAPPQPQYQAQPHRSEPQRYHQTNRQGQQPQAPQYKLQAKITGLERTGRKDPILRFDVHTNLPKFRTTQFRDVRRTHSEFMKLADHLISSNPEALVPAVPPALTSAGAGTDEDEARVKASLQRWLNYVCANDVLMRDDEMVLFVESDFGYSPMLKRKQPATGVRRKVIKQFAPPPDDTPELQEARPVVKLFYLGTMDAGHKVDKLVKARRGLGLAESDFGVKLGSMSVQEPHQGLATAYRKLGKTIQTTGDYHAAQGTAEATTIGDPLQYHSQDSFIVKETLTNRHILLRELLQAQQLTRSKLNAADRLKASSSVRREKVDEAISALDEARSNELYLLGKTQRVTANLMQEQRRWFARTSADLRLSIREYVIREIEAERRTLATLESVRPDIRAIDSSGGLSRLGREAHPATRRASLAASQGPKGDAWSGVPRRPDGLNRSISGSFMSNVPEENGEEQTGSGRERALSGASAGGLRGVKEEDDEDRVDARNAAARLATSSF